MFDYLKREGKVHLSYVEEYQVYGRIAHLGFTLSQDGRTGGSSFSFRRR